MKTTNLKRWLSLLLCMVLIAAMALLATGCSKDTENPVENDQSEAETVDVTVLGTGATVFDFKAYDLEGKATVFEIHTDQKTVGAALLEHKLIAGDESEYGLYVKTVNGITVDYNTDGKYWAFYVNGEYGATGVDATEIESGVTYSFKAE